MDDRGVTRQAPTAETTEWDEILISKGIVDRDDILRKKGVDPDELRIKELVVSCCVEWEEPNQKCIFVGHFDGFIILRVTHGRLKLRIC